MTRQVTPRRLRARPDQWFYAVEVNPGPTPLTHERMERLSEVIREGKRPGKVLVLDGATIKALPL